jgi:DsbC/DsbD-like thiol-disulfide interchange protein
MTKKNITFGFLVLLALTQGAIAASSNWATSGETRMRLIVAEPKSGDTIVRAALQVELAPGWKTYWQDPGEAGVPLQLDLTASRNIALKTIGYPAPHRFDDGVTVWAGYKEPVQFALELERVDVVATAQISASVFIGICEKICVPFQTSLTVNIENSNVSTADQIAVAAAFDDLPPQANDKFGVISMATDGKTVQIDTILKAADASPELFLAAPGGWQFGTPKFIKTSGAAARFEAAVLYAPKDMTAGSLLVNYTLIDKSGAVSGTGHLTR